MIKIRFVQGRSFLLFFGICALAFLVLPSRASQGNGKPTLDVAQEHRDVKTDLANAIVFIATEYRVPIVGELAATDDPRIDIPAGRTTARELLDYLVTRAAEYEWKEHAGVVHFYRKTLLSASAHPLNFHLKSFQLPDDVAILKISLPMRLYNASAGFQEGGGAISAFPSAELAQQKLSKRTFRDVTGRDILLAAAGSQPQFCSIIVLPDSDPKGTSDLDFGFRHWFWFAVSTKAPPFISIIR